MSLFRKKPQPTIRSLISEGTCVTGELRFADGLRIDGEVKGDVIADPMADSLVVISEKARVHGKVNAAHVIINGTIHGPVVSTQMLELQPKADVVGDVSYQMLEMHPGAAITGEMKPLTTPVRPSLQLAASNDA